MDKNDQIVFRDHIFKKILISHIFCLKNTIKIFFIFNELKNKMKAITFNILFIL
ncbi:hypothetical protein HDEF_0242 [Candidatus Hamiltonella defensa 5AT (Acyrthosiphon pisum)]|uniref:Uncharacterized protein n=1 Tax=Hamiltonella defensa subsp. Acyrthosiphon pisum (strain 5AT) TaxID=572265 RepID=C4K368_HAMD5|nr:hypothetical protein HDEF_0242 [Candidatus Hamiltonella defensa 5AT (Acyrthosiphon pisum)]